MTPRQPLPPPLRLLAEPLPLPDVIEHQPIAVISEREGFDLGDMATALMGLDEGGE